MKSLLKRNWIKGLLLPPDAEVPQGVNGGNYMSLVNENAASSDLPLNLLGPLSQNLLLCKCDGGIILVLAFIKKITQTDSPLEMLGRPFEKILGKKKICRKSCICLAWPETSMHLGKFMRMV